MTIHEFLDQLPLDVRKRCYWYVDGPRDTPINSISAWLINDITYVAIQYADDFELFAPVITNNNLDELQEAITQRETL